MLRRPLNLWLLAASLVVAGCSEPNAKQLLAAGQARLDKKEYRAALVEFKNALQKDGSLHEARFLMSQTLMDAGDTGGALVELTKLKDANYDNNKVAPLLAAAMLSQGQLSKLITDYASVDLTDKKADAELKANLAAAYGLKGKLEDSRKTVDVALAADPDNLNARLVLAQLLGLAQDAGSAYKQIEMAQKAHPNSAKPLLFKAQLLDASHADVAEIIQAYKSALKLEPESVQAHVGVIGLLIRQGDYADAAQQLEQLRKVQPGGLAWQYYSGLLAMQKKDYRSALESAQALLKVAPGNPSFLQFAGGLEFERSNYAQAIMHLNKAVSSGVAPTSARVLLARAFLRFGDPQRGLATLKPLLDEDLKASPDVYTLAGDAQARLGDMEAAKKLYQRALAADPKNRRGRTALALSDIGDGKFDKGVQVLKDIAGTAPDSEAETLLMAMYLQNHQFDQAQTELAAAELKQPQSPMGPYVRGLFALEKGDKEGARKHLEEAVKKDPTYFPAISMLAGFDVEAGHVNAAIERYRQLLKVSPRAVEADLAIVALKARAGAKPEEVIDALDGVAKRFPDAERPRVALVNALLQAHEVKRAQEVATEAQTAFPNSIGVMDAVGAAELAAGNGNQAIQIYSQMATLRPKSVEPLLRLAQIYVEKKDPTSALAQLNKAVAINPAHQDAQFQLVSLLAKLGKGDQALAQARQVQAALPSQPLGWLLEGDIQAAKANRPATVAAYKTALSKQRVSSTAVKLHRAYEDAGQLKEAEAFAAEWRKEQPDDPVFNYYLGDRYLILGQMDTAEALYRKVLQVSPNDVASMNNLAWIMLQTHKPGAIELIEKALALEPNASAVLDTAAEAYAQAGKLDKALSQQRRAVELNPNQPFFRLHLAEYLIKDRQQAAARQELNKLAQLGGNFSKQDEVKRLLATP